MWGNIIGGALGAIGNIIGGNQEAKAQQKAAELNAATQENFAKMGVRWKVDDAKAAGIHPLVALGAPTASFSPSYVGDSSSGNTARELGNMGQDIGRALSATRTAEERTIADLQVQSARLDLEGKALDNQIKNSTLRKMNQVGPAFPGTDTFIPGQGNSGLISERAMERTKSLKGAPHSEPGAITDLGWAKTKHGLVPVPSKDVKERIEDNMPQEFMHYLRNNVAPNWGGGTKPPKSALPKGATDWEWSVSAQEFRPIYKGKGRDPIQKAQDWYDKYLRWPK